MIKANSATEIKIATLELIKLDNKHNKKVVKSLKKWAAKILCWENNYVQDLANADDETNYAAKELNHLGLWYKPGWVKNS